MKYYREFPEIDISKTSEEALQYFRNFTPYFEETELTPWQSFDLDHFNEHVPSFKSVFEPLGITPLGVTPVVVRRGHTRIHIDPCRQPTTVRLNIPVFNCEYSETRFFELLPGHSETKIEANDRTNVYFDIPESSCVQVEQFVLKHLTALAVGKPHQVYMTSPMYPRLAITVPFNHEDTTHFLYN